MLPTLIVATALLLGVVGLRAERRSRVVELWLCNAAASVLVALTIAGHVTGRLA